MLDKSVVLILDPRGIISNGGSDVVLRHQEYQNELARVSNGRRTLVVITRKLSSSLPSISSLEIHQKASILEWFNFCREWFQRNASRVRLVIAGEPWITFWICLVMKKLFIPNSKLQLQVHGDFGNPVWRRGSFSRGVRYFFLVIALRLSDSVRAVGSRQAMFLANILGERTNRVFVSSVDYSIGDFRAKKVIEPLTLALVGRLEPDRGLEFFVNLIRCLQHMGRDLRVLVVGEGGQRKWLENELQSLSTRVKFLGQLSQSEIEEVWREISVLCSFAPVESFGRSSREALSRGVCVLGIESSGLRDLADLLGPVAGLAIVGKDFTCQESIEALQALEKIEVDKNVSVLLRKESREARESVALSWL